MVGYDLISINYHSCLLLQVNPPPPGHVPHEMVCTDAPFWIRQLGGYLGIPGRLPGRVEERKMLARGRATLPTDQGGRSVKQGVMGY